MTPYLIVTTISGKPYAVAPDTANKCMSLVQANVPSGLYQAYTGDMTACKQILNWINVNDTQLAGYQWEISPQAKYLK
jgi:hypothetical protein